MGRIYKLINDTGETMPTIAPLLTLTQVKERLYHWHLNNGNIALRNLDGISMNDLLEIGD